jgi:hypothetical protein
MQVVIYNLDGVPSPRAALRRDGSANLWLDGEMVLAVSVWESFVALTLADRLVLIRTANYERLIGYPCGVRHGYWRQ